jgi:adenylosuccinate synthase
MMGACAVIGGQFGSEGKGLIVAHIAKQYGHHVRVGAANAGHTFYTWDPGHVFEHKGVNGHVKHVMQQIPCAAYANPDATLYVGPGALISPEIFHRELHLLRGWRRAQGLDPILIHMDPRAHVITQEQIEREAKSGLDLRIGSTSATAKEGIGTAQADRVMREDRCVTAGEFYDGDPWWGQVVLTDVPSALYGEDVLLEGTQGTGLSLTTGSFPYTTSRNTTVAGLCADAGFAPTHLDRVILVCRTYPIRVAGNSGPFYPDSTEVTWDGLGIDPENERTTVTKKIRRVATFSMDQLHDACILNSPTEIALTFCDYLDGDFAGCEGPAVIGEEFTHNHYPAICELVEMIEASTGVPVTMLGTGPHHVVDLDRNGRRDEGR